MPLFDALERDVSSFFVSQGSIFDTILKTVLERLAQVETRVDASVSTVNQLTLSIGQANAHSVGVGDDVEVGVGVGVNISETTPDGGSDSNSNNAELEYFVLTLARQLNVVLALLFQPYTSDSMAQSHARQQQMPSISHILTDNEVILSGLSPLDNETQEAESQSVPPAPAPEEACIIGEPPQDELNPAETIAKDANNANEDDGEVVSPLASVSPFLEQSKHRNSIVTMIHHLHSAEEQRQHQEHALLQRMKQLLHESQASSHTQCKELHDQNHALLCELQQRNETLRTEWSTNHQQQQASFDLLRAQQHNQLQKDLEKQLLAFSNTFLASQTTQEQQIARLVDHVRDAEDRFLSKADLDQVSATWQQAARDGCIYGVDTETLVRLQHDLVELQQTLRTETPESPELSRLREEVAKVMTLLEQLLQMLDVDSDALHNASGSHLMQSLRQMVGQLEDLAHDAMAKVEDATTSRQSLTFLTDITRQMELGTASLLETVERQQEGYQQALSQQQADLERLKRVVHAQKLSDEELKKLLTACPSQEDTIRLVNALKEQIQTTNSDSASRMLGTLDDLRKKMAGLPTHDFLEELLHSKADRSEIDRLRLLLTSNAPTGNGAPSLSKSPTRCLSCEKPLLYMQNRPGSVSPTHEHQYQPNQSDRPCSSGPASPSRPMSVHGCPPNRKPHQQSMATLPSSHEHDDDGNQNPFVSPFTRAMFLVSEHGMPSTHDILRDLAATIESTKRRRQRMEDQRDQLAALDEVPTLLSFAAASGLQKSLAGLEPEDQRNKILLRRSTLSDQVVYGPSITSGFLKPRKSITSAGTGVMLAPGLAQRERDEFKTSRPKTAAPSQRRTAGGDVIVRTPSTTVVIRPFSETGGARLEKGGRRNTRAT